MAILDSLNSFGINGLLVSWMKTGGFWALVILLILAVGFGWLVIRKRRKLRNPVLILYDVGSITYNEDGSVDWNKSSGIFDFELSKGGWFNERFTLFKLWDYGKERIFRLADMTPIYDVSHNDYRKINGKNGLVIVRNPNDSKFVIPISKFFLSKDSKIAMAKIAPVDLRNAADSEIDAADAEMRTKWEKMAPIILAGAIGFILILSVIFITQYGKHMVDQSAEILKYATDKLATSSTPASLAP